MHSSFFSDAYIVIVDSVTVNNTALPYTFYEESFSEYQEDSWTYDGRYAWQQMRVD